MSHSRGSKVKSQNQKQDAMESDVFWMDLEEAKRAIADKFEYLIDVDHYEKRVPKKVT